MKRKMKDLVSDNIAYRDNGMIESLDVYAPNRVNMAVLIIVLVMFAFGIVMLCPSQYSSTRSSFIGRMNTS